MLVDCPHNCLYLRLLELAVQENKISYDTIELKLLGSFSLIFLIINYPLKWQILFRHLKIDTEFTAIFETNFLFILIY